MKILIFSIMLLTSGLEAYMRDFLKGHENRIKQAEKYLPIIEEECEKNNAILLESKIKTQIDPLLIGLIISLESSWKHYVIGFAKNERGLMQIHPKGVCSKGYNLTKPEQQIAAGVNCLRWGIEKCKGSLKQGLNMYAIGRCKPIIRPVKFRWRKYRRLIRKYKGK